METQTGLGVKNIYVVGFVSIWFYKSLNTGLGAW